MGSRGQAQSVQFNLQIQRANQSPYEVTAYWLIYPLAVPHIQPGQTISVKVDASDPKVIYPDVDSVEFNWITAYGWVP